MSSGRNLNRLTSIVLIAALATAVATVATVFGISRFAARDDVSAFLLRHYADTERTLRGAIDPRYQTKAEEIGRVAARLVIIDAVKGGALFDDTGHRMQTFGEVPETPFATVERTGDRIFRPSDVERLEFFFAPEVTGTPIHILVRVDAGRMLSLEGEAADRALMIALASGLVVAVFAAAGVWITVAVPVRRVTATLERVLANPVAGGDGVTLRASTAEIGMLATMIDRFRGTLADIWRSKVMVADAILERSPFAVVQMAADGSPTFANAAAAGLFDRDVVRAQATSPIIVRDVLTGGRSVLREFLHIHEGDCRLVEIAGLDGPNYALVGSMVIGEGTRTPTTIAMFADATSTHRARLKAEQQVVDGAMEIVRGRRRELELKLTLESCIALMAGPDKGEEVHIDVLPHATEWLQVAAAAGLVQGYGLIEAMGPTVAGSGDDLKAVIRLGLLVAVSRCTSIPAKVVVDGRGINFETAGFTIRSEPLLDDGRIVQAPTADWRIAFAALRSALRRVNGQLSDFAVEPEGVTLRFVLRGASERMSAVKAR